MAWNRIWQKRLSKLKRKIPYSRRLTKAKLLKYTAIFGFLSIVFFVFLSIVLFAWYAKDLPRPDKIVRKEGFATRIFDREGKLLYDVYADQRRTPVELEQVPKHLQQATIAIEDKNFYKHEGFDPTGWLRAVYNIIFRGRIQGGSTLTQQLVKNVLLTPKRTLGRKIKEFFLAVQIENKYSKDQILQMYLNEAPYGGTAWGVQTAAETYFGKNVSELSLVESAILAGLPQRPSYYSPFGDNPKAYLDRVKDVLRRMREDDYISKEEEKKALEELEKVEFSLDRGSFKAPHFVMYVKKILEERYGERMVEQGGLKVYTTLDLKLQEKAQEIVTEEIKKVESLHITNGALVAMDTETGEILSMVGSKDYFDPNYDGKVNVCLSLRQPGSSIKPVTYLTALKKGYTAATLLIDVTTHFPGGIGEKDYVPKNYDNKAHGPVQLRFALGSSLNISSVKLLAMVGLRDTLETATDLGFTTLPPTKENISRLGLSFTLGGGEIRLIDMVAAYSTFANSGLRIDPVSILKVEDNKGKILEEFKSVKGRRVITEEQAFLINNILSDNNARLITFGQNSLLNIGGRRDISVKTGTTDDYRDNWTVGWTPKYIVGVWVGNNDNSPMKQVASGVSGAAPIWRGTVLEILKGKPISDFLKPSGILEMEVDKISGYKEHDGWEKRNEYFIQGTEPSDKDSVHTKLKVCKADTGKLAPDTIVVKGEYEEKEFIVLQENDPISSDDKNRWQEGIDAWIANQQDSRYKYPKEYCQSSDKVVVNIKKPEDKEKIDSNEVEVEVEAVSNNKIEKIEFWVDGEKEAEISTKPFKTKLVLSDGPHAIKAKAEDAENQWGEKEIKIGVKVEWDWSPSPTPAPCPAPTLSPTPNPSPSPSVSPIPSPTPD